MNNLTDISFSVSVFAIVVLIFFLNEIATHLQNWWHRSISSSASENEAFIFLMSYFIKVVLIILTYYLILRP